MAKRFLTARDIDEQADNGVAVIEICDDIVLTDVARERARERGVKLERVTSAAVSQAPANSQQYDQVKNRVRAAIIAKLGSTPENLDAIINKVLNGMK
jgi:hypothetical protein